MGGCPGFPGSRPARVRTHLPKAQGAPIPSPSWFSWHKSVHRRLSPGQARCCLCSGGPASQLPCIPSLSQGEYVCCSPLYTMCIFTSIKLCSTCLGENNTDSGFPSTWLCPVEADQVGGLETIPGLRPSLADRQNLF